MEAHKRRNNVRTNCGKIGSDSLLKIRRFTAENYYYPYLEYFII